MSPAARITVDEPRVMSDAERRRAAIAFPLSRTGESAHVIRRALAMVERDRFERGVIARRVREFRGEERTR